MYSETELDDGDDIDGIEQDEYDYEEHRDIVLEGQNIWQR
jgi:hypothetical protein